MLVNALKQLENVFINTIVTMSDDWWSTGFLRDEYGISPPGDIRRALVALSSSKKAEFLRKLFAYRFKSWLLKGHNLWNLIMVAAEDIVGEYGKAINFLEELLDIKKGKVYPATFDKTRLVAKLETGEYIVWETNIDIPKHSWNELIKDLWVVKEEYAQILKKAKELWKQEIFDNVFQLALKDNPAHNSFLEKIILEADYIFIWPGDLYTSILPNILVGDVKEFLKKSQATKVYVWNLFTKFWETNNFKLSDFVKVLEKYLWKDFFDLILVHDWGKFPLPSWMQEKYEAEKKQIVKTDISEVIKADLVNFADLARHDVNKLAKVLHKIIN